MRVNRGGAEKKIRTDDGVRSLSLAPSQPEAGCVGTDR